MLLLGHRGAAGPHHPENTLASVERALQQGADGVEVDVRTSSDGRLVCCHDPDLRRTAGDPRQLVDVTAADLDRVRISGHRLPPLAEVLDLVAGRGRLVVEVKRSPGSAWAVATALVTQLRAGVGGDVVVSSFDRPRLRAIGRAGLPVRTALLSRPGVPLGLALRRALADSHDEAHVHVRSLLVRPELVVRAHELGLWVTAWTVDRPSALHRLAAAGVDAAICDDPWAARIALGQERTASK